jgi:hypothetical protein
LLFFLLRKKIGNEPCFDLSSMCEISSFHTSFYQLIQSLFGDILELLSDFEASFDLYFFIEYNPFRKEVNEFKDPEFGLDVV